MFSIRQTLNTPPKKISIHTRQARIMCTSPDFNCCPLVHIIACKKIWNFASLLRRAMWSICEWLKFCSWNEFAMPCRPWHSFVFSTLWRCSHRERCIFARWPKFVFAQLLLLQFDIPKMFQLIYHSSMHLWIRHGRAHFSVRPSTICTRLIFGPNNRKQTELFCLVTSKLIHVDLTANFSKVGCMVWKFDVKASTNDIDALSECEFPLYDVWLDKKCTFATQRFDSDCWSQNSTKYVQEVLTHAGTLETVRKNTPFDMSQNNENESQSCWNFLVSYSES